MGRGIQRVLAMALILALSIVLVSTDMVYAAGVSEDTVSEDISIEENDKLETIIGTDNQETMVNEEDSYVEGEDPIIQNASNDEKLLTKEAGKLNYFYIEKSYLKAPDMQKLVLSFGDGTEDINEIKILCSNENGTVIEMPLVQRENDLYLFEKEFSDSMPAKYTVDEVIYSENGQEKHLKLNDIGIESGFGVNDIYAPESISGKSTETVSLDQIEASVVSIEEDNSEEIQGSVADAIQVTETTVEPQNGAKKTRTAQRANVVVVLDPGHGGSDSGTTGYGLLEKDLNLKIARYCKAELEKYAGVTVRMTREDDRYVGLEERVVIARNYGANVFVSLHNNSATPSANGAEVFYPNSSYNYSVHQDGRNLAANIQAELTKLGLANRGIKERHSETNSKYPDGSLADYYSVIKNSKLNGFPGIIVEHAFVSNASDAAKLQQESFLNSLGVADAIGIANAFGLQKKSAASVEIVNKNDFEGNFKVKATTTLPGTSGVSFNVWRKEEPQKKMKYTASKESEYEYVIKVDKKDFDNQVGEYIVQAVITYNAGDKVIETKCILKDSKAIVSNILSSDEKKCSVNTKLSNAPDNVSGVRVAAWSEAGGGADLKWYSSTKKDNENWKADIIIDNHKQAGRYTIDTYVDFSDGTSICVNSSSFFITSPTMEVSVGAYDVSKGTFEIIAKNIKSLSGVKSIRFPVWNKADAGTMYWYDAVRQSDGTYKVIVNIENHNYSVGDYIIHGYITTGHGVTVSMNAGTCKVVQPESSVVIEDISNAEKTYQISARNLGVYGKVTGVRSAVWSVVGKGTDLKWYNSLKDTDGVWNTKVNISDHKQAGEYIADTYVTLSNGASICVNSSRFTVTAPTMEVNVGAYDAQKGTFEIVARNIQSPSGVNGVRFPVWNKADASTMHWYNAVKQADGSYKAVVSVNNHKSSSGTYMMHGYITTGNGIDYSMNAGTCEVTMPKANVTVKDVSNAEKTYQISARNLGVYGIVTGVRSAVWSVVGKGTDLKWYSASKDTDGVWNTKVNISAHKQAGEYIADTYVTLSNGASICVNSSTFTVTAPTMEVNVGAYDAEKGTFEIVAKNIQSPSGVNGVRFPVWNKADASTMHWYNAVKQADGSYKAVVSVNNHKSSSGTYMMHGYITTGNGIDYSMNAGTCEVTMPKANVTVKDISNAEKTYQISGRNLGVYGIVTGVRSAVWSVVGKGTDLKWYNASKDTDGVWNTKVNISDHKQAGEYIADTYVTLSNGASICVNSSRFTVTAPAMEASIGAYDASSGTFEIVGRNIQSSSGISKVQFPVWNEADASTMYWYNATKQMDGSYKAVVNVRNHKYSTGIYRVHGYVTGGNQVTSSMDAGSCEITETVINDLYAIMGETTKGVSQMVKEFNASNKNYPSVDLAPGGAGTIESFCRIIIEEANAEGVKGEVLFAQIMLETGCLKFGGDVKIKQYNFGGLGATGGVPGNSFPDVRIGIRAQAQHLKCYASNAPLNQPKVDPRWWDQLRNKAPYVQWLGIPDNPYGYGWAAGANYGKSILTIIGRL